MPTGFEKAFAKARAKGLAQFNYKGKQYTTQMKGESEKLLQLELTDKIRKEMAIDPSLRYVSNFNTGLTKQEFNEFLNWAKQRYGSKERILYEMGAYDLQGAWKAIKKGEIDFDPQTGHLPDTYKKPNHITFSNESRYSDDKDFIGGQWRKEKGKWKFKPSPLTIKLYGKDYLREYFSEYEKDADLDID
jgi:hypothetical protein